MYMRIIWGRIRPGQWERYEAAYKEIFLANQPAIDGLEGRWLVRDVNDPDAGYSVSLWKTAEAMQAYEAGEFFRTVVRPALQPYFVDDFTTARCEVRVIEDFGA
jgi:heme-degrading monooxygenase HmoA